MTEDAATTQPVPEPAAGGTPVGPDEVTVPAPPAEAPAPPAPAATPAFATPAYVAPPAPAASSARGPMGLVRSLAVGLFFFLTCASLVLATTTWWLHDTLLDTDHFVALTAPLAQSPAVQERLAEVTTNQVDEALDLGPIGRYVVGGIASEVYASDAFANVWARAMRVVHTQLVTVLRGESKLGAIENGQIVINLFPVIDAAFQKVNGLNLTILGKPIALPDITNPDDPAASRAELSAALGRELKPTFGTVPIAPSAKLEQAQQYVTFFDTFVIVLFVIAGLLAILTLALARRRLRMVALLGIGALAALLAARLGIASAADGIATAVAEAGPGAIIGGEIAQKAADAYREFARLVLAIALVAAVVTTVLGYLLERRGGAGSAVAGRPRVADGWFLTLAGLCVALAALLVVGLTLASLVGVAVAYVAWLALVVWWGRRRGSAAATA